MARNYIKKGNQTDPLTAGEQNLPDDFIEKNRMKRGERIAGSLSDMFLLSLERAKKSTTWTPEEVIDIIDEYFAYCDEHELKPSQAGIRLFLGLSKAQYYAWMNEPERYGIMSDILKGANEIMESQYITRGEKYPTMNMFLLKSSFGHQEKQTIEITEKMDSKEIEDRIKNLGLKKSKE